MQITYRMRIEKALDCAIVSEICNRYWQIRSLRPGCDSKRRQLYREIKIAHDELLTRGADRLELHHWKRSLASMGTTNQRTAESQYQSAIERLQSDGKTPVTKAKYTYGSYIK